MATHYIEYDTLTIGKKGNMVNIPKEVSELLKDHYLFFSYIQKIERRPSNYADNFVFVPVYRKKQIDFELYRKDGFDINRPCIRKGIDILNKLLYQ